MTVIDRDGMTAVQRRLLRIGIACRWAADVLAVVALAVGCSAGWQGRFAAGAAMACVVGCAAVMACVVLLDETVFSVRRLSAARYVLAWKPVAHLLSAWACLLAGVPIGMLARWMHGVLMEVVR